MNNFIETYTISDSSVCDALIDLYEKSPNKKPGLYYSKGNAIVERDIKDSTDLTISISNNEYHQEVNDYLIQLNAVVQQYKEKYKFSNCFGDWQITENFNIQHYAPGGGYKVWHSERSNAKFPATTRHLVWMTYLNDVTDAGETEFYYQKIKIQPRKGLTAIWPADWTHTHRGIVSPTQEKYIITGWFNFIEN